MKCPSSLFSQLHYLSSCLCISVMLSGCVGNRAVESADEHFLSVGWQNNQTLLDNKSFSDYADAVKKEVRQFRIPFDPSTAELEVEMTSPVELQPGANCNGQTHGIAILVHGLADTAYSLRDIGGVLADACYKSRVILLPGHGTRGGDLLTTRLSDWQDTLNYLVDQANEESDKVLLVGFSLGSVLTLNTTLSRPADIDGVIAISPAYYLSSERIAKWAPIAAPFMRWIDRGVADDPMRYEVMPTRGVAETWSAMKQLQNSLQKTGSVKLPWMLIQSMDDAVIDPDRNEALWDKHAAHLDSRLIRLVSTQLYPDKKRVINLPGKDDSSQVIALTHLAIHQSPENPHYGVNGNYRNCGSGMPRDPEQIQLCIESDKVWYGLWSTEPAAGQAMAYSTFNPSFDSLAREIQEFAKRIAGDIKAE